MKKSGMIHVYTGNGKGKTTAAIGIAVRAAGAGKKILFLQFIKSGASSEFKIFKSAIPQIEFRHYGKGRFIKRKILQDDLTAAEKTINEFKDAIKSDKHDMIILDEVFPAIKSGLITEEQLLEALKDRSKSEIILTGRYAPESIIKIADLVTEMKEIKHYYKKGLKARKGIEF